MSRAMDQVSVVAKATELFTKRWPPATERSRAPDAELKPPSASPEPEPRLTGFANAGWGDQLNELPVVDRPLDVPAPDRDRPDVSGPDRPDSGAAGGP